MKIQSVQKILLALLATSVLTQSSPAPVWAEDAVLREAAQVSQTLDSSTQSVEQIDEQILKKEVSLLRLNTNFRTHYIKPERNRKRRLKLFDLIGGGIANAGDITLIDQFRRYQNKPGEGLAHKGRLQSGAITVLVAYLTMGSLYAGEGVWDLYTDYKGKKEGYGAKSILKQATALKTDIDTLLENRKHAVDSLSVAGTQREVFNSEDKVLRDSRDLALLEFCRLYIDSRKRHTARDITTLGTLIVCATGAFPGAYGVINGLTNVNLKQVGGGGIGFLISGSTLTAAPVLIHGGAAVTGKLSADKLLKTIGAQQCKTTSALATDAAHLNELLTASEAGSGAGGISERAKQYNALADLLKDREAYLNAEAKRQKREVLESFISYMAVGGPQIAWGATLTRAGYRLSDNPVRAFHGVASGAIVNETSWGMWLMNTLQKGTRDELSAKRRQAEAEPFNTTNVKLLKLEGNP